MKLVNAIARSANKENSLTIRGSYQERTPTVHRAENAKVATTAQRTVLDATHATKDSFSTLRCRPAEIARGENIHRFP